MKSKGEDALFGGSKMKIKTQKVDILGLIKGGVSDAVHV